MRLHMVADQRSLCRDIRGLSAIRLEQHFGAVFFELLMQVPIAFSFLTVLLYRTTIFRLSGFGTSRGQMQIACSSVTKRSLCLPLRDFRKSIMLDANSKSPLKEGSRCRRFRTHSLDACLSRYLRRTSAP